MRSQAPTDSPLSGKNIIHIYIFSGVSVVEGPSFVLTPLNFSRCNVSASKSNISLLNIAERSLTSLFERKGTTFPMPQFPNRHETS